MLSEEAEMAELVEFTSDSEADFEAHMTSTPARVSVQPTARLPQLDLSDSSSVVPWSDCEDDNRPLAAEGMGIPVDTSFQSIVSWSDTQENLSAQTSLVPWTDSELTPKVSSVPNDSCASDSVPWSDPRMVTTPWHSDRGKRLSPHETPVVCKPLKFSRKKISFTSESGTSLVDECNKSGNSCLEGSSQQEPNDLTYFKSVPDIRDNFKLLKKIGRGGFGTVYLCSHREDTSEAAKFAMKFLTPISSVNQIHVEIEALQKIGKHMNVIELLTATRYKDQVVLVFPYFKSNSFHKLIDTLDLPDIQHYMMNLLSGLSYIHSIGITHRDIKPSNFLYNKHYRLGKIIDFGISEIDDVCSKQVFAFQKPTIKPKCRSVLNCYHDQVSVCSTCLTKKSKKVARAGTPGYRAPEVLLGYRQQTRSIDVWSSGVVLLSLLSGRHPFFVQREDLLSLAEITSVFGKETCIAAANRLHISLTVSEDCPGIPLELFCARFSEPKCSLFDTLIRVLKELLVVDTSCRRSAENILTMLSL